MNLLDRARIGRAVLSYDFWLDARGVSRRRRRELTTELRGNLLDASADRGARGAVGQLGSLRQMAREATVDDPGKPRWRVGFSVAAAATALVLLVELLAALSWVDGAMAGSPGGTVSGSMALFPGSAVTYSPTGGGFAVSFAPGWLCLAVGALALLLASRPWRVLTHRGRPAHLVAR
jgi:hypothetical protein